MKDPIAFLYARGHLLFDLAAILIAFKLALCGDDRFNELAFWRIFKCEIQAFNLCTAIGEFAA
ncbi:hypothetical protein A3734_07520 [Sulfitobacter sp. HI0054]|nr:hypothetical protein A3734_07520 [Sulfitobacter sp. HI0054]